MALRTRKLTRAEAELLAISNSVNYRLREQINNMLDCSEGGITVRVTADENVRLEAILNPHLADNRMFGRLALFALIFAFASPFAVAVHSVEAAGMHPIQKVYQNYLALIVRDGDWMNDWLTHMAPYLRGLVQIIGRMTSFLIGG